MKSGIVQRSLVTRTSLTTLLVVIGLIVAVAAHAQTYGGRAYGALVGGVYFADTGSLSAVGGSLTAAEASIQSGILSTGPANSACSGADNTTQSSASVQAVVVTQLLVDVLSCSSVSADASVTCTGVQASSTITDLVFGGVAVVVTGDANQTVSVPGLGTLIINEQVSSNTSISVNALHLMLDSGAELILCGCESSLICPLPTEPSTWGRVKALYS